LTNYRDSGYFTIVRRYIWLALGVLAGTLAPAIAPASAAPQLARTFEGGFFGVAATSARDAWAVGDDANNPLILHWNGSRWRPVTAANPSPGQDDLDAVAARTARDAWAVGARGGNALVEHWNGSAWKSVPNPRLSGGSLLVGVVAMSATNAWAVGGTGSPTSTPLIEHWNGKAWQRVAIAYKRAGNLFGVTASSATNIWAVGVDNNGAVLTLHWDGRSWRQAPAPSPVGSVLIGVSTTSVTNAWAVGGYTNGTVTDFTLVEHWNGKKWTRVAGPSPRQGAVLLAVAARSPSLAFAVGTTQASEFNSGNTFLEEWNGHVWREVIKPTPFAGQLSAVAFAPGPAKRAWAVGSNDSLSLNPNGWTLIEGWNGASWG
jgi:hypothetical protein